MNKEKRIEDIGLYKTLLYLPFSALVPFVKLYIASSMSS